MPASVLTAFQMPIPWEHRFQSVDKILTVKQRRPCWASQACQSKDVPRISRSFPSSKHIRDVQRRREMAELVLMHLLQSLQRLQARLAR